MKLTALERYRLEVLVAMHRRPPTLRRMLPRAAVSITICSGFCFLLAWALPADPAHPHLKAVGYTVAVGSVFYFIRIITMLRLRWRLTEAITNWQQVELLHASTRKLVTPPEQTVYDAAMQPFTTAEAAIKHVKATTFTGAPFELPIAEGFTFAGRPDQTGMGMAVVVDGILKHGYFPRGFEQRQGYRLYRYAPGPA